MYGELYQFDKDIAEEPESKKTVKRKGYFLSLFCIYFIIEIDHKVQEIEYDMVSERDMELA